MAERRQRILGAARRLVAERGYEALTMRELAQVSRVTVPTLYNLIGGKAVLSAPWRQTRASSGRSATRAEPGRACSPCRRLHAQLPACRPTAASTCCAPRLPPECLASTRARR
jgi:AcrR family transcriptional regulator